MTQPFLIGICGGTASGKSCLADKLLRGFKNGHAQLLCLDRYYLDRDNFPARIHGNYDHPLAVDTDLLRLHLKQIRAGQAAAVPTYDYSTRRRDGSALFSPTPVILVEGLLLFALDGVSPFMDTTIFVDVPSDIRLARRLRRDTQERGRSMESVLEQYEASVRPMHEAHVQPYAGKADFCISGLLLPDAMVRNCMQSLKAIPAVTPHLA